MVSSRFSMVVDEGADESLRAAFVPSWILETEVELSQDMLALLDEAGVSSRFKDFCRKCGCTTPLDLGAACSDEKSFKEDLLDALEYPDIGFVERKNIKKAWLAARAQMGGTGTVGQSAPAQSAPKRMPDGAETRLRTLWKDAHGMNLPGAWLVTDGVMTPMFLGLHNKVKSLHVPDVSSLLRRSMLNQKPAKGTLITDSGIEQLDYSMTPCSTHPEFYLRMRSFIMSIAYIVIATPDFFSFETAIELVDYIFESINCRPDGRRPGLVQLTACYLSMFGEYAKALQNHGTTLEEWLGFRGNWHHIWRDAASADAVIDNQTRGTSSNLQIPDDLTNQLRTNNAMMKGMQSNFDKKLNTLQAEVRSKQGDKVKKKGYWSKGGQGNGGKGQKNAGANGTGKKTTGGNGGEGPTKWARGWESRKQRGKGGKGN